MKPFFSFYGGKWRVGRHYPNPMFETIVEPFAGSAGYSVRHFEKRVVLVERDPKIAATWRFLLGSSVGDILALPEISPGQTVNDLNVCEEARYLIGWWLNKGSATPKISPSYWMRQGLRPRPHWGPEIRSRLAHQVEKIKHWVLIEADWSRAPNIEATWFVDPPYEKAGKHYRYNSKDIDYFRLSKWCSTVLRGQIIVCENVGASWLPFQPLEKHQSRRIKTRWKN